ncbi:MAG: hypothetical protein N2316_13055 [Spirochaetes bacterium]|nr:hypothetical protein [Spirochaetota bacterium]
MSIKGFFDRYIRSSGPDKLDALFMDDRDGIIIAAENLMGTNFASPNSDAYRCSDWFEYYRGTSPFLFHRSRLRQLPWMGFQWGWEGIISQEIAYPDGDSAYATDKSKMAR